MSPRDAPDPTIAESGAAPGAQGAVPGLLLLSSAGVPQLAAIPLLDGALEIGRGDPPGAVPEDWRMSRRHARVAFDGRRWTVKDLGSRNGTAVDGVLLAPEGECVMGSVRVLRMGASLFLLCADLRPLARRDVEVRDGVVLGARMAEVHADIARAARESATLQITGESGTGRELCARAFHAATARSAGPFVTLRCQDPAVSDLAGAVCAADGGTLFLSEAAALDLEAQAELLQVLETRELTPPGAARARAIDILLCSSTHRDPRLLVAAGRLRQDLYLRICRTEVALPPLRERPEELPWLLARELALKGAGLQADVSLLEACLLRRWPGNVRELNAAVRAAAREAIAQGSPSVEGRHLQPHAGLWIKKDAPADQRA